MLAIPETKVTTMPMMNSVVISDGWELTWSSLTAAAPKAERKSGLLLHELSVKANRWAMLYEKHPFF
jgi:hypothetical protein